MHVLRPQMMMNTNPAEIQEAPASPPADPMDGPDVNNRVATAEDPPGERTTCWYLGYKHVKAWASNTSISFRCSQYRSTGCRGSMRFTIATMGYTMIRSHTCHDNTAEAAFLDVSDAMRATVDGLALSNLATPASAVWAAVRRQYYGDEEQYVVRGLTEHQVESRVYFIRARSFGSNVLGVVDRFPLGCVLNSTMPFIQAIRSRPGADMTEPPIMILLWGHPALINLVRYHNISLFIDGTFRCVPRRFAQCVVMMVHDRATGIFVPVFYALTSNRTNDTYWDLLHEVIQATDQQIDPADVVCDFEQGLMAAVRSQFPNAEIIGCLFHFKQAIGKRMKKLRIPPREIAIAMERGMVDMLTVIDPDTINPLGIKWVKTQIKARCAAERYLYSKSKWEAFWRYFVRTWTEVYNPADWNVHGLDNSLVARTNNPLERFNRELNAAFPTPHPSLPVFIGRINQISCDYVQRLADVPRGRTRRVLRERISLPVPITLPEDNTDRSESGSDEDMHAVSDDSLSDSDDSDREQSQLEEDGGTQDQVQDEQEIDTSFDYDPDSMSEQSDDFSDNDGIYDD